MPVSWRLHVLEERLKKSVGDAFAIESVDLYDLPPIEQHAAINAIITTCGDFPVVFVDGAVACIGDMELETIVTAVAARSAQQE